MWTFLWDLRCFLVAMQIPTFNDLKLHPLVYRQWRFRWVYCLFLLGQKLSSVPSEEFRESSYVQKRMFLLQVYQRHMHIITFSIHSTPEAVTSKEITEI